MPRKRFESRGQKTESGDLLLQEGELGKWYEQDFVCEPFWNQDFIESTLSY
jgi:hypothetical protein